MVLPFMGREEPEYFGLVNAYVWSGRLTAMVPARSYCRIFLYSYYLFVAQVSERIAGHWYDVTNCIVIPNIIDQSSFFVYAIHACGLFIAPTSICLKLEQCSSFQNEWLLCLLYLLSPFMVYGISVVYYYVLNKFFKPIMPVLTGNR